MCLAHRFAVWATLYGEWKRICCVFVQLFARIPSLALYAYEIHEEFSISIFQQSENNDESTHCR